MGPRQAYGLGDVTRKMLGWLGKVLFGVVDELYTRVGLRDVGRYWGISLGLGVWLFHWFANRDICVDGPYVLSSPVEAFALGLYVVAAGLSSLVNYGPWIYSSSAGDQNSTS